MLPRICYSLYFVLKHFNFNIFLSSNNPNNNPNNNSNSMYSGIITLLTQIVPHIIPLFSFLVSHMVLAYSLTEVFQIHPGVDKNIRNYLYQILLGIFCLCINFGLIYKYERTFLNDFVGLFRARKRGRSGPSGNKDKSE